MLQCLTISGFRSYSQADPQKIQFDTPLTLIWGKNGSGKTTIIETLKYIIGGVMPQSSKNGIQFISSLSTHQELVKADARLKLRALNGHPILARRQAILRGNFRSFLKMEQISPTIRTINQKGKIIQLTPTSQQMDQMLFQILGTSKPIIEHVLLCRHEECFWPFTSSYIFKSIFEEMKQIKKYQTICQAFQQQKAQYLQQIENKSRQLYYLKRLYEQDNKRKLQALHEMEKICYQSQILVNQQNSALAKFESALCSKVEIKKAMIKKCQCLMAQGSIELQGMSKDYLIEFGVSIMKQGVIQQIEQQICFFQIQRRQIEQQIKRVISPQKKRRSKQLQSLSQEIKRLSIQKDYLQLLKKCKGFEEDMNDMLNQLSQLYQLPAVKIKEEKIGQPKQEHQIFESKKRQLDLRAEIALQEYEKPIEKQFLRKKVQISVIRDAVEDIQSFCNAIYQSISIFQQLKIEETNSFLSKFWKKVYKGTDITNIRIEVQKKYSVVVENSSQRVSSMSMNGHSSMGQKILASILIRLALAKVFSPKSCMIALDDPTAHLDREAIQDLTDYLKKILEMNEFQSLQLIVISQDLQFIESFSSFCQSYYQVTRGYNNFSVISKKAMI